MPFVAWYLDQFWRHFHARPFDTLEGATNTTLASGASVGDAALTLTAATGFVVDELIVVGSGSTWQSFTVTAIAGAVLTVAPAVAFSFAGGTFAGHGWGNDAHPSFQQAYQAIAQMMADTKQRTVMGGLNMLGPAVGMLDTVRTDARSVASVPAGWESLGTATFAATSFSTADTLPQARSAGGVTITAAAIGDGMRTLPAIPVRAGDQLVATAMARGLAGAGFQFRAVDKANPGTVLAQLPNVIGTAAAQDSQAFAAPVMLSIAVPAGVTAIELRFVSTGTTDQVGLDDVRLFPDRQLVSEDRYVFEDPGTVRGVVWMGDSWGVGAAGAAEQFRTALENRLGHSIVWQNAAVTGNKLSDMIARFATDCLPYNPRYVVWQYGANDLSAALTQAQMEADADQAMALCRQNGFTPVFLGMPPYRPTIATAAARNDQVRARVDNAAYAPAVTMANAHGQHLGDLMGGMYISAPSITTFSFVNATDQVEVVFQVPDDAGANTVTITRLGYQLQATTGTSPQMKISLQGVDASGNPDGTIKGGASPASALFTPAGGPLFNWVTLDNPYTAVRGERLAWVIAYNSGTINSTNRPIIGYSLGSSVCQCPYSIGNVAGTRTRVGLGTPLWGFGSTTKAFGNPVQGVTATTFSTSNERALRFLLDPLVYANVTVIGVKAQLTSPAAARSVKFLLYDGTTVIQTATWDSDHVAANGQVRPVIQYFEDSSLAPLVGGHEYRLAVAPQDATNNVVLHQLDFAANADLEALPEGMDWFLSTRSGGGATAWTDVTTSRPWVVLILGTVQPAASAAAASGPPPPLVASAPLVYF